MAGLSKSLHEGGRQKNRLYIECTDVRSDGVEAGEVREGVPFVAN